MRTAIAPHELLPKGLELESLSIETGRASIAVSSGARRCLCPVCGRGSSRVHSRYWRTVSDLPWHGISVELASQWPCRLTDGVTSDPTVFSFSAGSKNQRSTCLLPCA